ncbi:cephalosporin hydroxylase family protein [Aeromonas allosaccharophila]|uniref:cephalosporin hydroxylase family protein n=1 Tax=Aeromonas allosaccharophila TaxID=656 RepID=UPI001BCA7D72|nr:cephalosporin hydroxylase family protein [Aeromonas allosaccharophila]MBS4694454.1 cephalosporin hydroxylase family protein [Aeromonas allosaccharophila]
MNPNDLFKEEVETNILSLASDMDLQALSRIWIREIAPHKWSYNFRWMGRPAIQFPNDAWAMQELIWEIRPDLIIETGIAHGGSLIFSASMLAQLDLCEAIERDEKFDAKRSERKVIGIDIDIRSHNRDAIEKHPMSSRIHMIQGSSTDEKVIAEVRGFARKYKRVLVCLDSNHTHDHVLAELNAYAPLVSVGSYCVVFDTIIEDMPDSMFPDRPWGKGNNPKTAVWQYLNEHDQFVIDADIPAKLQITVAPDGFLKRMK